MPPRVQAFQTDATNFLGGVSVGFRQYYDSLGFAESLHGNLHDSVNAKHPAILDQIELSNADSPEVKVAGQTFPTCHAAAYLLMEEFSTIPVVAIDVPSWATFIILDHYHQPPASWHNRLPRSRGWKSLDERDQDWRECLDSLQRLSPEDVQALQTGIRKEWARACRATGQASSSPADDPDSAAKIGSADGPANPAIKCPTDKAFRAYWVSSLMNISSQAEIAVILTKEGIPANQGQVSKWLTAVKKFHEAGGIIPNVQELNAQPQSVDPDILVMGERQDGRTPRQPAARPQRRF